MSLRKKPASHPQRILDPSDKRKATPGKKPKAGWQYAKRMNLDVPFSPAVEKSLDGCVARVLARHGLRKEEDLTLLIRDLKSIARHEYRILRASDGDSRLGTGVNYSHYAAMGIRGNSSNYRQWGLSPKDLEEVMIETGKEAKEYYARSKKPWLKKSASR